MSAIDNLHELINADLAQACNDGVQADELMGLAGAISESFLRAITPKDRLTHWNAVVRIMNRKFEQGKL